MKIATLKLTSKNLCHRLFHLFTFITKLKIQHDLFHLSECVIVFKSVWFCSETVLFLLRMLHNLVSILVSIGVVPTKGVRKASYRLLFNCYSYGKGDSLYNCVARSSNLLTSYNCEFNILHPVLLSQVHPNVDSEEKFKRTIDKRKSMGKRKKLLYKKGKKFTSQTDWDKYRKFNKIIREDGMQLCCKQFVNNLADELRTSHSRSHSKHCQQREFVFFICLYCWGSRKLSQSRLLLTKHYAMFFVLPPKLRNCWKIWISTNPLGLIVYCLASSKHALKYCHLRMEDSPHYSHPQEREQKSSTGRTTAKYHLLALNTKSQRL